MLPVVALLIYSLALSEIEVEVTPLKAAVPLTVALPSTMVRELALAVKLPAAEAVVPLTVREPLVPDKV